MYNAGTRIRKLDTSYGIGVYVGQKRILLAFYTVLILYLMLFGFGRTTRYETPRMSLAFTSFPMWFPNNYEPFTIWLWIFSLGNILAFAPFGVLIPDCFPHVLGGYRKSLFLFLLYLTMIEYLQYITRLGIFDIEDIVANMIGYSIGYWAWRMSYPIEDKLKKANLCIVLIGCLTVFSIALAEILNSLFFIDPFTNLIP